MYMKTSGICRNPWQYALPEATGIRQRRRAQRENPSEKTTTFDVYINHRSPDTKQTLARDIYNALGLIGIRAFLDVYELKEDSSIPDQIQKAMDTARLHIAIFSKRYAESTWCLSQLSSMLQTGTPIIPVFYHVDPSDLRYAGHGKGFYADAFSTHEKKGGYPSAVLQKWEMALQRVSNLSGHMVSGNVADEQMLLTSIVKSVSKMLGQEPLKLAKHPVGMDEIVLDSNNNSSSTAAAGPSARHHGAPRTSAQISEVEDHPIIQTVPLLEVANHPVGMDEIIQDYDNNTNSSVASSSSVHQHGPPRASPQVSEENYQFVLWLFNHPFIHEFADLASTFNWSALALVLGSYGLLLSNLLFWMCWSILIIKAVIYISYKSEESESTTRLHTTIPIVLKIGMSFSLIIMLLCTQDITERPYTMLLLIAAFIILFEGVTPLLRGTKCQTLKALEALIPSTLNAMITTTGPIVFGGDLGRLMQKHALWGFTFIFLVDGLVEVFSQIVSESAIVRSPKTHHVIVVVMLRLIVEGCLSGWMGKVIYQDSYFTFNLGIDDCNKLCRERSKHLLITVVALGGLQAAGTLCCLLLHLRDRNHSRDCKPPVGFETGGELPV